MIPHRHGPVHHAFDECDPVVDSCRTLDPFVIINPLLEVVHSHIGCLGNGFPKVCESSLSGLAGLLGEFGFYPVSVGVQRLAKRLVALGFEQNGIT